MVKSSVGFSLFGFPIAGVWESTMGPVDGLTDLVAQWSKMVGFSRLLATSDDLEDDDAGVIGRPQRPKKRCCHEENALLRPSAVSQAVRPQVEKAPQSRGKYSTPNDADDADHDDDRNEPQGPTHSNHVDRPRHP